MCENNIYKKYEGTFGVTHVLLRTAGFLNFGREKTFFRVFHQIYQSFAYMVFVVFAFGTVLQLIIVRADVHMAATALSATLGTGGILAKTTLLMRKRVRISRLQKRMNQTLVCPEDRNDAEIQKIYQKALNEMRELTGVVYGTVLFLIGLWVVSGIVTTYSEEPRLVPLPNWVPWDVNDLSLYVFTCFYQGHGAFFVGLVGVSINLTIFGSIIQMSAEYEVLMTNLSYVRDWCNNGILRGGNKFRVLSAIGNRTVERMLLKNIQHHQKINYCINQIEDFYHHTFLVQFIFTASLGSVLSVKIVMMIRDMDARVGVPAIFFVLLWSDIFYFCSFGSRLKTKSCELADNVYSIPWEIMNAQNQALLRIIILKAQRPPRLTIEKISDMDVRSLLQLVKIVYNFVYWVYQLSSNDDLDLKFLQEL